MINTQTLVVPMTGGNAFAPGDVEVLAGTAAASKTTVTVRATTATVLPQTVAAGNTVADSAFDIEFYGTPVAIGIEKVYDAIPTVFGADSPFSPAPNQVWVGIVGAVDSAGNAVPLNPSQAESAPPLVGLTGPSTNIDTLVLTGVPNPDLADIDPFVVGVLSQGSTAANNVRVGGTINYTVRTLPTLPNLTASSSYVASDTLAGSWTATFDKAEYLRGERATLTVCANDLAGRIVPDGLLWYADDSITNPAVQRGLLMGFNAEVGIPVQADLFPLTPSFNETTGASALVSTGNGCVAYSIVMPANNVDLRVSLTPVNDDFIEPNGNLTARTVMENGNGWAASVITAGAKTLTVKVGTGSPDPGPERAIMIVGERGKGDNANRVFVEGTTEGFGPIGGSVTPYFRFPGETGFTQGTGVRSVDAQGNFAWQRKTGKQIAVQFRAGDVRSNTVIIEAK